MSNYSFPDMIGLDAFSKDSSGMSLEDFIHHRTKILGTKLEVLISEMNDRLRLKNKTQLDLDSDKDNLEEVINKISVAAGYGLRDHKDKISLSQKMFELNREKRNQDTACWVDTVRVMRDFLDTWDDHEQAKAKSRLLKNV